MLALGQCLGRILTGSVGLKSGLNITQIRTKIIYRLGHVSEVKRYRKQGYQTKLKTVSGRRLLMERILKKDKVIAH